MNNFNKLHEIKYLDVKPNGWLKDTLLEAKKGMPGNLHNIGYPFDTKCWEYKSLTDGGWSKWWPYEQMAYWIDGIVRMAGLLDDEELYGIVKNQIDTALGSDDTFIGPIEIKAHERCFRWPIAVFARALYARWSFTGDEFYLEKLRDHYLNDASDYSGYRDVVNVETMLRLYEHFGDERLLDKAITAYEKFDKSDEEYSSTSAMLSDVVPIQHGVTYNEHAKLAAILYSYTGKKKYLDAAVKGYEKLDRYDMLPDGVHTSCEFTYGNETKWAHESCDISDYTWSLGYLLEATGNAEYADKIERAILNAAFGAIGPHFNTIQYFSSVNQVIATRNSTNIEAYKNAPRMAYQPHHYPECCVGNICRAIPNYVLRMYQKFDGGVCVSLYGDSIYDGEDICIVQTGGYPFGNHVKLQVTLKESKESQLRLRIPGWAKEERISRNDEELLADVVDGYMTIYVQDGDVVELHFEKEFISKDSVDGGVYFEYGPFLMALKIDEKWEIDELEKRQTKDFPAYNVYPASAWNYCVTGKEAPQIEIQELEGHPYWEGVPFEIKIDARVLHNWDLVKEQLVKPQLETDADKPELKHEMGLDARQIACGATEIFEDLLLTPELPCAGFVEENKGKLTEITLVPYGCTNLRVTVFPKYIERG